MLQPRRPIARARGAGRGEEQFGQSDNPAIRPQILPSAILPSVLMHRHQVTGRNDWGASSDQQ